MKKNSKGISPILASVLLLAVTISVAGVFSGWAPDIAQSITEQTENQTDHRLDCNKASATLVSATYNISGNEDVDVTVRNNGRADFEQLIVAAFDTNNALITQETNVSADRGELTNTTINSVNPEPSYIQLYSEKCGDISDRIDDISQ